MKWPLIELIKFQIQAPSFTQVPSKDLGWALVMCSHIVFIKIAVSSALPLPFLHTLPDIRQYEMAFVIWKGSY